MRNNRFIKSIAVIIAAAFCLCSCTQKGDDKLKEAYEAVSSANETTDKQIHLPFETKSSSTTSAASTTATTTPKDDLTNPVCLEYFLWDNYEKTYTDGSESITFAYQEPDGGGGLRSTYPDIQYIANFRPGTELHFRVYKDREEAIARGVRIKFETNDMILCGYQDADVTYGGHINGVGYDTNFEWSYDGSLIEENFQVIFRNCAVIGMNPYIKVTISADGYKNKTFNIKVNRSENYIYNISSHDYTYMDYVNLIDKNVSLSDLENEFGPVETYYSNDYTFWVTFNNCPITFYYTSTVANPNTYHLSDVYGHCFKINLKFSDGYGWYDNITLGKTTVHELEQLGYYLDLYDDLYYGGQFTYIMVDGKNIQLDIGEDGVIYNASCY